MPDSEKNTRRGRRCSCDSEQKESVEKKVLTVEYNREERRLCQDYCFHLIYFKLYTSEDDSISVTGNKATFTEKQNTVVSRSYSRAEFTPVQDSLMGKPYAAQSLCNVMDHTIYKHCISISRWLELCERHSKSCYRIEPKQRLPHQMLCLS